MFVANPFRSLALVMLLAFSPLLLADEKARILVLGDSLSAGYGIELEESWVSLLAERLDDAQVQMRQHKPKGTFYSRMPGARIDHVYVDRRIEVNAVQVPRSALTLVASDHLPLVVDVLIPDNEPDEK